MKKKVAICWILAVLITLGAAYYQRTTGPTYPKKVHYSVGGKDYSVKFPRSHESDSDCSVELEAPDEETSASILYKRYQTNDDYDTIPFTNSAGKLIAALPAQPPAGKLQYFVIINSNGQTQEIRKEEPVVIRFKGAVPLTILLAHVLVIFCAMLFSNLAGLFAIFKHDKARRWTFITLAVMFVGGFILGPIMQKYAFGAFWTGIPFGWDLTDNKTLIALVAWIAAVIANRKQQRIGWIIAAALITIIIFSIPHSLFGSQLNYDSGQVQTG